MPSPFPKHNGLLKGVIPSVFLPILNVIRKLSLLGSETVCDPKTITDPDLAIEVNVNIIESSQIKRLSNNECLAVWQVQGVTPVSLTHTALEILGDIILMISRRANLYYLAVLMLGRLVWVFLSEI